MNNSINTDIKISPKDIRVLQYFLEESDEYRPPKYWTRDTSAILGITGISSGGSLKGSLETLTKANLLIKDPRPADQQYARNHYSLNSDISREDIDAFISRQGRQDVYDPDSALEKASVALHKALEAFRSEYPESDLFELEQNANALIQNMRDSLIDLKNDEPA